MLGFNRKTVLGLLAAGLVVSLIPTIAQADHRYERYGSHRGAVVVGGYGPRTVVVERAYAPRTVVVESGYYAPYYAPAPVVVEYAPAPVYTYCPPVYAPRYYGGYYSGGYSHYRPHSSWGFGFSFGR